MRKTKILTYLIMIFLILISCKKEINNLLETDYKVIDFYYGYDNYHKNLRNHKKTLIIRERNIVEIKINEKGICEIEGVIISTDSISHELKKYLTPNPENSEMPETLEKEFTHAGKVLVNHKLVIAVLINQNLNYKMYSKIRNKFYEANNQIRNEFALKKYGKELSELIIPKTEVESEQMNELIDIFPFQYFEIILE